MVEISRRFTQGLLSNSQPQKYSYVAKRVMVLFHEYLLILFPIVISCSTAAQPTKFRRAHHITLLEFVDHAAYDVQNVDIWSFEPGGRWGVHG
jgi:membrane-anchored protein YejM (alkaline phosphatase superfamily)